MFIIQEFLNSYNNTFFFFTKYSTFDSFSLLMADKKINVRGEAECEEGSRTFVYSNGRNATQFLDGADQNFKHSGKSNEKREGGDSPTALVEPKK